MSDLAKPIVIRAAIKRTATNAETGERTLTLTVPKSEAGKVAQLSVYDQIVFEVTFKPQDVESDEPTF